MDNAGTDLLYLNTWFPSDLSDSLFKPQFPAAPAVLSYSTIIGRNLFKSSPLFQTEEPRGPSGNAGVYHDTLTE